MNEAGVQIRDYMGDFVANHVDLSEGKVALKVSAREVEILGESLVKEVIGWAMEPKGSTLPEYGDYSADFLAGLSAARISTNQRDKSEDDVLVKFTSRDALALGQFFILGMLRWVQSIQIARRRVNRLREAILAKQAEFEAESKFEEDDKDDGIKDLFNMGVKWKERYE
jgi:hypothetical protein